MRVILVTLAVSMPLATARAQLPELEPGTRVRIRAPHYVSGPIDGTLVAQRRDSLTIARRLDGSVTVPVAKVTRLEVSRGRSWRLGAVRGSMWGSAAGLALGTVAALGPEACSGDCGHETVDHFVATPLSGALLGAGVGALIGAERWTVVRLPAHLAVVRGTGGRIALGLRLGR